MKLDQLQLSNNQIYAGSGFMKSNVTSQMKSILEVFKNNDEDATLLNKRHEINLMNRHQSIYQGYIYYRKATDSNSDVVHLTIYKYGARRLNLQLPTDEEGIDSVTVSVIMPSLLFANNSHQTCIAFENFNKPWPFHNVFSYSDDLDSFFRNSRSQFYDLCEKQFYRICTGFAVEGINFFKTPELYVHTILTGISNFDLSALHAFNTNSLLIIKSQYGDQLKDQYVHLNHVSSLFEGDLSMNDLFDCHTVRQVIELLEQYVVRSEYLKLLSSSYRDFREMMDHKNENLNLIIVGIFSAFNNLELIETLIKSF